MTWEGTILDNTCPDVKSGSNQLSSLYRQIRTGVYLSCDGAGRLLGNRLCVILRSWKSFANRITSNRTDNRHRWAGRVDQGERVTVV